VPIFFPFYFVSTVVLQIEDSSSHVSGVPVRYLLEYILEQLYGGDGPMFWSAVISNILQRSFLPVFQMIEQSHQKSKTDREMNIYIYIYRLPQLSYFLH